MAYRTIHRVPAREHAETQQSNLHAGGTKLPRGENWINEMGKSVPKKHDLDILAYPCLVVHRLN